MNKILNIILLN